MKLLIDGNILLDVLQRRTPYFKDSVGIWKICETKQVEGYVSALTLLYNLGNNILFILYKVREGL